MYLRVSYHSFCSFSFPKQQMNEHGREGNFTSHLYSNIYPKHFCGYLQCLAGLPTKLLERKSSHLLTAKNCEANPALKMLPLLFHLSTYSLNSSYQKVFLPILNSEIHGPSLKVTQT